MERESRAELPTSDSDELSLSPVVLPGVPRPVPPYSPAIVAGGFLFVSGQRPQHPTSGDIPDSFAGQAHQVFRNLTAILEAAQSGPDKVVKVNIYLADLTDFAELNSIYEQYFRPPYPARTTIGCSLRGILIEVDVVALAPNSSE
jgi:2-iminobutanoate/2-iminopropanoate deaminase